MLMINLKVFILTVAILNFLTFTVFYFLSGDEKVSIYKLFFLGIIIFLGKFIIGDWIDFLLILYIFIEQKYIKKIDNYFLVNTLLLSLLFVSLSSIIASNFIIPNVYFGETKGLFFMINEIMITLSVLSLFLLFYKKFKVRSFLKENESLVLTFSLLYVYLVLMLLVTVLRKLKNYDLLINFVLLSIIFQSIFIILFFLRDRKKRQEKYEEELFKNQLESLKNYTEKLEDDYLSVRKFKHDYKNILLSLRISVENNEYDDIVSFLNQLDDYSTLYFKNSTMDVFRDLSFIKNEYIKSIFINKLHIILKQGLNCQFECRDNIEESYIDIVDMIRLISIILDNGIEAALETKEKLINIALLETESDLIIKVENSYNNNQKTLSKLMESGYSTKKSHSGLGLTNIQEIKNKYSNLFIQYEKEDSWFSVKLIINKE